VYLRRWLCDYAVITGNIDRAGGAYLFTWDNGYNTSGHYTARVPGQRVAFTSHSEHDPGTMQIEVAIAADADNTDRTRVTLTQHDIPAQSDPDAIMEGWRLGFDRLAYFLETGLRRDASSGSDLWTPALYASAADLSDALRRERVHLALDLSAILAGVTDADAVRRPSDEVWSISETLAHLIFTERYLQLGVYGIIGGDDYFAWNDNNPAQLTPILTACPTLDALIAELKRAWDGSVGQIAALPPAIAADRLMFTQITLKWDWAGEHAREHFDQIRAAIAAH